MIECKSCGAVLRFDIASQMLQCDYCRSEFNVDEFEDVRTADNSESERIDMYSFSCPQCGGTIYGGEQDMTGFCSYCGSPVELAGRLTSIERPERIIPFKMTKENCKDIFLRTVRSNPFLPSAYKDKEHIESFRGIYMPYYIYNVKYDGNIDAFANDKYQNRRGDYVYTNVYKVTGGINGYVEGFEHDSSSTFDDEISESVSPYITRESKAFKAGYVSGFYADSSDVSASAFMEDAKETANKRVHKKVSDHAKLQKSVIMEKNDTSYLNKDIVAIESHKALYPVWFMSYKNGDRVAYAAINGQTGKIAAYMPIDFKKFLLFALLTAIPLYLLLNFTILLSPKLMMIIYMIAALLTTIKLSVQAKRIMKHEEVELSEKRSSKSKTDKKKRKVIVTISVICGTIFLLPIIIFFLPLVMAVVPAFFFIPMIISSNALKTVRVNIRGIIPMLYTYISLIAVSVIQWKSPADDIWYYGSCIALLLGILWEFLSIVRNHNFLATRRPVQFDKQGGDNNA